MPVQCMVVNYHTPPGSQRAVGGGGEELGGKMNRVISIGILLVLLLVFGCSGNEIDKHVQKEMVGGILHLMNPEQPLNGNINFEIEKTREINPYEEEDFGLRWMYFRRDIDGEVMLFNPNGSEIHRFNSDGKYLGNLIGLGQGPGEFLNFRSLHAFFVSNQIFVAGTSKLARFKKSGDFISEKKIGQSPDIFVDENRFFMYERARKRGSRIREWIVKISLTQIPSDANEDIDETIFFQKENVGAIENLEGDGYTNPWGIPDILYAYDGYNQRLFVCLNTDYKIYAKNLNGKTEFVIEKPYEKVSVTPEDKRNILFSSFQDEPEKWHVDSFPDSLVAIKNLKSLPNGYLAAYKVTDINTYQIDIFNPEGHYVYSVAPLENIDLDEVIFYSFGFARIATKTDCFMIYEEYRIKNLPEIFGN